MSSSANPAPDASDSVTNVSRSVLPEHVDVLIVGAGISGIGLAYRLEHSGLAVSYAIVEARDASGGTWDLFRYPGVRSDSDMFTLSYPFRPWQGEQSIAGGEEILGYIRDTATENGIDQRIHFGRKVVAASWSTPDQRWTVTMERSEADGRTSRDQVTAGHVHMASGYYSYDEGHDPDFAGRDDFRGQIVHPQFWPEDLDHSGKRVVVIGSGATAVTLVPAMADRAAHVTMLQRTPSYVISVPRGDKLGDLLRKKLPDRLAHHLIRGKNIALTSFIYQLSRRRPAAAKKLVMAALRRELPQQLIDEHFTPPYDVWDQRLCAVPSGDFFTALRSGSVDVVTDTIDRFLPEGIRLSDGTILEADVVVTATGLVMKATGGIEFTVDGDRVALNRTYTYRGVMLAGMPNASMTVGYTNSSWTLRADLISKYVISLLGHMRSHDYGVALPVAPRGMRAGPILDLASGYVQRAIADFPKVGDRAPWTMPQNYVRDMVSFRRADITADMLFLPRGTSATSLPRGADAPAELPSAVQSAVTSREAAEVTDPAPTEAAR